MSGGWTVTPVTQDQQDGSNPVVGFDFRSSEGYDSSNDRFYGNPDDYYLDNQGNSHHVFEDVSLEDQTSGQMFDRNDYEQTVLDDYGPELQSAIEWARTGWDPDRVAAFDQALEDNDYDAVHQNIDLLLKDFNESGGYVDPEQSFVQDVYDQFGGQSNYQGALQWAQQNYSPEVLGQLEQILNSGNPDGIALATQALRNDIISHIEQHDTTH